MNVNAETEDATLLLDGLLQNVAIIRFDTNKKVTYANALFAEAMGYSEEEMLKLSHPDLCFPDFVQSASYKAMWTNLLAGQKFQNKIERKNARGERVWFEQHEFVYYDDGTSNNILTNGVATATGNGYITIKST
ncbi:PAS domain S-box protein, partial [Listeria monocytogenes]|uniref:PAS domain S-box protein n=1 Tax=Listeria monocytogenes TaxID=1639 RepID=UPI0021000748